MNFDLSNLRLSHKIAFLVLSVSLFVVVAIGTMGDWMLRSVANDIAQARMPSGVATLQRMSNTVTSGSLVASRVVLPDGKVGILLTQADTAPIPAVYQTEFGAADTQLVAATSVDELIGIGEMRSRLLMTCIAVLALGALLGFIAARIFTEPLSRLVSDFDRLAKGDTTVELSGTNRTDEIGDISRAGLALRQSMVELKKLKSRPASSLGSFNGFMDSLREQWASTKRVLSGEWNFLATQFRKDGHIFTPSSHTYAPGPSVEYAWKIWRDWVSGDSQRSYAR